MTRPKGCGIGEYYGINTVMLTSAGKVVLTELEKGGARNLAVVRPDRLEADSGHATQAINRLKPDWPAAYSTACSNSEHPSLRRSDHEREPPRRIWAGFDSCNNALNRRKN